ncbi:outer membrane beta-barrel protein [Flagellimonas sp. 389]|uniref:outer membrane protein n=1 Tax=Flagellimonas sp. 389 TaxID=2835862 RepID=UPI001BD3CC88|nr:outer membrane beta-barrel protein [Flagellimonas sp. 389]MBS9464003.1 outer membrane beta-barrel protein [Flagellimonas sp. 389]
MKRVVLVAALFGVISIQAQEEINDKLTIEKGTWILGGNVSIGTNNFESTSEFNNEILQNESDRFSVSVFPRFGYAFNDNWIVGLVTEYSFNKTENENFNSELSTSEFKSESLALAPYVRRYFGVTKNLAFYAQGELGYGKSWSEDIGSDQERRTSEADRFFVGLRPGISFFASKNLAFESSVGLLQYTSVTGEDSSGAENENQGFNFNLNASNLLFGLSYFF